MNLDPKIADEIKKNATSIIDELSFCEGKFVSKQYIAEKAEIILGLLKC